MKIAVMGTHGVQKSTIALKLASILKQANPGKEVAVMPELARSCPYPVNENMTEDSQRWLMHKQILSEIDLGFYNDIVVCDRTVIDGLAYALYGGLFDFVAINIQMAVDWFNTYDRVFWIRPGGHPLLCDNFRSVNVDFQVAVDQYIKEMVDQYHLNVDQGLTLENIKKSLIGPPRQP
jgi:drug/metabolite transporter superfamily protein YnfA